MIGPVPPAELHQDLRAGVRTLCKEYPDTYWRDLDARRAYPEALVKALTDAGYLDARLQKSARHRPLLLKLFNCKQRPPTLTGTHIVVSWHSSWDRKNIP